MAHSTAGQCSVVKRAPTPSVLWPSLPPVPGKMVEAGSCSCARFFSASRLAVARRVLQQRPLARAGREAAFLVLDHAPGLHVGQERVPVEAEVGRDAGILRDAQIVLQQELIDGGHGIHQIVMA
jgi:hypothetical protein